MTCPTHGRMNPVEVDRITVRGRLLLRYMCEQCDAGDWWEDENANVVEPDGPTAYRSRNVMALYRTTGPRALKHRVVLYLRVDRDWTGRNLERNGHQISKPLIGTLMPAAALKMCGQSKRARSFQYDGLLPRDPRGLRDDMLALGCDPDTAAEFETVFRLVLDTK